MTALITTLSVLAAGIIAGMFIDRSRKRRAHRARVAELDRLLEVEREDWEWHPNEN